MNVAKNIGLCFIIIILTLFGFLLPCKISIAASYTVTNVKIDVTAKNALEARDKAFEKAQVKAFTSLAKRLADAGEIKSSAVPSSSKISNMIQDFEVTKENVSAVRYIGLYTFRFSERAVKKHYGVYETAQPKTQDIKNTTQSAHNLNTSTATYAPQPHQPARQLILPFYKNRAGNITLWDGENPWKEGLEQYMSRQQNASQYIIVPQAGAQQMRVETDASGFSYDEDDMRNLIHRYNVDQALLAVGSQTSTGTHIDIYDASQSEPKFLRRVSISGLEYADSSQDDLWDAAARRVKYVVTGGTSQTQARQNNSYTRTRVGQGYTPTPTTPTPSSGRATPVQVSFQSLQEWASTYKTLKRVRSINHIELKSLSSQNALLDLYHAGSVQNLQAGLEQAGLNINLSNPMNMGGGKIVYPLSSNKYTRSYTQRF